MRIKVRHCHKCEGRGFLTENVIGTDHTLAEKCLDCDGTGHIVSIHEEDFSWWQYLVEFAKSFKAE